MLEAVLKHLEANADHAERRLQGLLRIPSVATDPAYGEAVTEAAAWVATALREAGLEPRIVATDGHPVVLAQTPDGRAIKDGPHVIFYGHYDVQPPDPVEKWDSDPFAAEVRDGNVYARGAADDKGPVVSFLEALRAWHDVHKKLPVPVTVVVEGEEESGSPNLAAFLEDQREVLSRGDFVLLSDTNMWDAHTPAITYGLRGLLYFDLKLHNANRDLHSGMYGGIAANPAIMLTQVLGRLFDSRHRVTIPGFYDDVEPVTHDERQRWEQLDIDPDEHWLEPIGVDTPFGENGFNTMERLWVRPSCDINGLYGGYGGAGAKTVIPSFAGAKVSFRLAPKQDPQKIADAFEAWLREQQVHGCRWEITRLGGCPAALVPPDSPWIAAASRACERVYGKPAVLMREGATIPIIGEFQKRFGLDSVLLGFDLSSDLIHAPNEHFALERFHAGARTHAAVLAELAGL